MLRRLHHDQPDSFAFTPANQAWAEGQMTKYPEGRQASAIIPLLWRAQEQEGWLTRPAIEHVSEMLGLAYIRGLEVATFYFMFQLQPVGSVAHIQICGTTTCMICGAEDLVSICQEKIAKNPHELSADGKFSWEEVECLGACANAPMAQIGKDYYEDLTADKLVQLLDDLAAGKVPTPGPQNGRFAAEPASGLTSLKEYESGKTQYNASAQRAVDIGDTVKRIDGTEVPLLMPWQGKGANKDAAPKGADASVKRDEMMPPEGPDGKQGGRSKGEADAPRNVGASSDGSGEVAGEAGNAEPVAKPETGSVAPAKKNKNVKAESGRVAGANAEAGNAESVGKKPEMMTEPRESGADDLKMIKGVGPKLENMLNGMGIFHFDQIATWGEAEVAWADSNLKGFKGRVSRDSWVDQAVKLAAGEQTAFSAKARTDGRYKGDT
ncbi:ATP synthase subunit E [Sulfitobacter noctilucicola]|uniref:NADH-quinone oxidoreductase subunit E n=1 Tax=Sulfitobacter noctilucicola TaxID=1342301 RepID=A0A7W6M832_9RHOB|nr:NADH-quinone oxidoreductase subunit E [Sulfitobacter noctilucicola]KIN64686.1 ATP synthase subunit E [Sulfitobacter noctilucicola]MBB4174165.1 NADH-quinone oxidoreductase subunit E [Sulfitobacter noctilucicola]